MWTSLLTEPKAVLGPYAGSPPGLNSFAPHSLRSDYNHVALAGQFLDLPPNPPERWRYGDAFRAYAVFEFLGTRNLRCAGVPSRGKEDDSLHFVPVGELADCALKEIDEIWFENPEKGIKLKWRSFSIIQSGFSLHLEAESVTLYVGRQAIRQYGWPCEG